MAEVQPVLYAFNRGRVSKLGLARLDLKRTALSAQIQDNCMPRRIGSMMLRPGWQHMSTVPGNAAAVHIPFAKATTDLAYIQLVNQLAYIYVNDAPITRVSVATQTTNGTFTGNITGWADSSDVGGSIAYVGGNFLGITGTGFNRGMATQTVSVAGGDQAKEHALRVVITRGPVTIRVGTSSGADDLVVESDLNVGTHSLAFTPGAANIYIQLWSRRAPQAWVDSCVIEAAGTLTLPTPWLAADFNYLRWTESVDVIFIASDGTGGTAYNGGYMPMRIERRSTRSWSIANYVVEDGPFRLATQSVNQLGNNASISAAILTPSATQGDITLASSVALFVPQHVGALFSVTSSGQDVTQGSGGANQFSQPLEITGTTAYTTAAFPGTPGSDARTFTIKISGTFSGTVTLQRSISAPGDWVDVPSGSWSAPVTTYYRDGLANVDAFYQIGIKGGNYTSGTANVELSWSGGSNRGIVRVTAYLSTTSVMAAVLTPLGNTGGSAAWQEGQWSDFRGYPSCLAFFEGRLWFAGRNQIVGSASDAYNSFDETIEGDSGPINRTVGQGMVDQVPWLVSLYRLIMGGQDAEQPVRGSNFDDPITPSNMAQRRTSTQGSAIATAVQMDTTGFFIQRSQNKVFALKYSFSFSMIDYTAEDTTVIVPEIGFEAGGFVKLAVQRQPDTRIHGLRTDGSVAVLISDPSEDISCWVTVHTNGTVEDIFVQPGTIEDQVYYLVNRTINGVTVRHLEKWAREDQCQGGTLNLQGDDFVTYTGAPTTTISAAHLPHTTVVIWGDGKDQGLNSDGTLNTYTTDGSGNVTLNANSPGFLAGGVSNYMVGLPYTGQFQSAKLAQTTQQGTGLMKPKSIGQIGLLLDSVHAQGISYGPDFSNLDPLPQVVKGAVIDVTTQYPAYDDGFITFPGTWDTDSRVCLQMQAPRNCTVLAVAMEMAQS